jgi:hypothetical protein
VPAAPDRSRCDRWINQVERWFGPLTERALRRGVHRSVADLERAIHTLLEATTPTRSPSAG